MRRRLSLARRVNGHVNGVLENGYFKGLALLAALGAYLWQGATWKTQMEMQIAQQSKDTQASFNMVSYQVADLDKRMATELVDITARLTFVEHERRSRTR